MYCKTFQTLNDAYYTLVNDLMFRSDEIAETHEISACIIEIKHPSLENMHFYGRKISEKYMNAELKWYWSGSNSCEEIGQYAKKWLDITDDGITNNSAYGYILTKKYGYNQIEQVIELLKKDPNTRRAVLNISDQTLNRIITKDMQCTVSIQYMIRDNELLTQVYMRSNDIRYGFPYDYIYFMTLTKYIAHQLGIKVGPYIHHAGSMHLYNRDIEKFVEHEQYITVDALDIVEKYYEK